VGGVLPGKGLIGVWGALLALALAAPAAAHDGPVKLTVDAAAPTGAKVNRNLVGVNWHGEHPRRIRPLGVDLVRHDASLEHLFPKGPELDAKAMVGLNDALDRIVRAGGRPLVILSYMPAWLGDAYEGDFRDPTKLPPRDREVWRSLVERVVTELTAGRAARGRRPVRRFEVWNEPDWPIFWQDSPDRFFDDVFVPSAQAVAAVEQRTGRDLRFGGCACVGPDPAFIERMVSLARERDLPLDFVSWHWYANTPFLGPDGREPLGSPEQQALIEVVFPFWGRRNPAATPASYGEQIGMVREWVAAALAGSDRPLPELYIDEWNLSAGGFDKRMDTNEGAAFQAAVLMEMQRARLTRAATYSAVDPAYLPEPAGGWGLVTLRGTRKPAWWTYWLWRRLAPEVVAAELDTGVADGVWALASRARGRVTVLASSFLAEDAHPHALSLELSGLKRRRWKLLVRRVDAGHRRAGVASRRRSTIGRDGRLSLELDLPAQSVLLVELKRWR
jgi:xylan 1,4-beta-xylosidase